MLLGDPGDDSERGIDHAAESFNFAAAVGTEFAEEKLVRGVEFIVNDFSNTEDSIKRLGSAQDFIVGRKKLKKDFFDGGFGIGTGNTNDFETAEGINFGASSLDCKTFIEDFVRFNGKKGEEEKEKRKESENNKYWVINNGQSEQPNER